MSKRIISTILLFLPLYSFADYNGIGFKLALGYYDAISLPVEKDMGVATAFDLIYEYNNKHFLFQTGIGIHYNHFNAHLNPFQGVFSNMIDEDRDLCRYGYLFNNRHDDAHIFAIEIPISFGGIWNLFYFLIGGNAQYSLAGIFKEQVDLTTWGEYHHLINYLENMPNHNYFNQIRISSRQRFTLPFAICVSAEIGIDLSNILSYRPLTQNKIGTRIAIFSECTINNLSLSAENLLYDFHLQGNEISKIQISDITMQHCYKAKDSNISTLRFWEVGVRYTLLITLPLKNRTCHCLETN